MTFPLGNNVAVCAVRAVAIGPRGRPGSADWVVEVGAVGGMAVGIKIASGYKYFSIG
jgi:hypothetical protein